MKILTKEEEQEHYNATVRGGILGGTVGTIAGAVGVFAASRRYPAFRTLTPALRAFLITSAGIFSAIVAADSSGRAYEHQRHPNRQYEDHQATLYEQVEAQKSTKEKTLDWLNKNRYGVVFGSWVASMATALGLVGRNPYLTGPQKLVQARVYAQGLTVAVVIISLAFETTDRKMGQGRWETVKVLDPNDPTHKHMIEKRIHHERYAGEDQWMDMVEAEEQRMKEREEAAKRRELAEKSTEKHSAKQLSSERAEPSGEKAEEAKGGT
ncbi:hypothetical protein M433DRAFT_60480 [Acidomyces richmondensis BFW]|nr:MAG: hypothetical protein FE78DRAFT_27141 [Acidomyces sp. 'richmondensis']KYG48737.1 hypothetical protein M433DRAFT_60480 [Acidomyces richmondensis BFW]